MNPEYNEEDYCCDGSDDDNDDHNIHPVDSVFAVILCSDDFLRQDLLARLAKCQVAIPFIIPDPFTKQLVLPLWAMRSIAKEMGTDEQKTIPIVKYKMPIISFLCIGKHPDRCIAKILNEIISESVHKHFFHHDCPGAEYDLVLGKGLVNMLVYPCW